VRDRWFTGYAPKVGSIDVAISVDGNAFATLASFDDFRAHDMVTVTNFTLAVKVPPVVTQHAGFHVCPRALPLPMCVSVFHADIAAIC
jgi:hypothetical protein